MARGLQDYRSKLQGLPEIRDFIEEYEANNLIRVVLNVWDYVKDREIYVVIYVGSERYSLNFGSRHHLFQFLNDPNAFAVHGRWEIRRGGDIVLLTNPIAMILSPTQSRILLHKLFQVYEFTKDVSGWRYDDSPNVVF